MRAAFFVAGLGLCLAASGAMAQDVYHNGYYNNQGTYVQPHYQTAPNNSVIDNYSTRPNVNPYNGNVGTVNPYAPSAPTHSTPSYSTPSYSSPSYGYGTGRRH